MSADENTTPTGTEILECTERTNPGVEPHTYTPRKVYLARLRAEYAAEHMAAMLREGWIRKPTQGGWVMEVPGSRALAE